MLTLAILISVFLAVASTLIIFEGERREDELRRELEEAARRRFG